MSTSLCRHVHTNGSRCGSPSLSGNQWCYFHNRLHQRHSRFRYTEANRGYLIPGRDLELLALEDPESIQLALSMVINALATGGLENKRASALLYGLQLASANAARVQRSRLEAADTVRDFDTSADGLDLAISQFTTSNEDDKSQEELN